MEPNPFPPEFVLIYTETLIPALKTKRLMDFRHFCPLVTAEPSSESWLWTGRAKFHQKATCEVPVVPLPARGDVALARDGTRGMNAEQSRHSG